MTRMFPRILLVGAAAVVSVGSSAYAQWQPSCASCAPPPVVQCVQPQPCYTTVPVTEMREYRQIVQKPVVETSYVDQQVTTYEPVVEDRETEVPTVAYQDVTECRQVTQDCGYWTTQYQPRPKMTPCQYDSRPDLFGFLNRVGYGVRSAFTPNYSVQHAYVPNVQTVNVPVTRRVAVHGTRKVNYRVTRMVPRTTTQKVAVNTVRMTSQEVVTRRPVTVYRSVPLGSTVATYAAPYSPTTARAPAPQPGRREAQRRDPSTRSDLKSEPIPKRQTDDSHGDHSDDFGDFTDPEAMVIPKRQPELARKVPAPVRNKADFRMAGFRPANGARSTATRVGQWIAHRTPSAPAIAAPQGPSFPEQVVALSGN